MDLPSNAVARPRIATVRQRLRDGLAPLHERLDARITADCLLPRPDLPRLLAVHAQAFPPVVAALHAAGATRLWPEWDGPERLAALLSEYDVPHPLGEGPLCFETESMTWGGLYALLGSRLGNKLILRRLAEGGEPANSAFLRPGADDGPEWRRFLDRLEEALGPASARERRDAVEGGALVMNRYLAAVERIGRPVRVAEPCH